MVRKLWTLVGVAILSGALVGCGSSTSEIKADATKGGQKLESGKQQDAMAESMKFMPPEMKAKMEAQMEQMKKLQEGDPAKRGTK